MNTKITTADSRLPDSATGAMPASGEHLSADERRRLLDTLLRNRAASSGSQSRIPKLPRNEGVNVFAASFAQERLWFFTQFETNSPFYNQTLGIMARGRLNEAVLKESLSVIANRHETMRTTFVVEDQRLVQIVSPDCSVHLDVIDLTTLPSGEREAAKHEIVSAETNRPFDLAQGPVLRSTIVRLGEEESFLIFSAHHIVTDYWGLSVFLTELTKIYSSLSEGLEPNQAAPVIQYADFAMWHRDWMRSGVYEKQLAYWKKQLEGAETLRLPTDFARPPIQAFRGAIFRWPLGAELASKVRAFSDGNGVTLYMALLTVFKVLLQRYSGQQDVIVGTPIANRSLLELERIIGFFSNTLVLRTELGRDISFRSALDMVKQVCLAAYIHQDLPFEKLVEELQPERDLSRNPLFQVMFRLQTKSHSSLELKGLSLSQVWDDDVEPGARFDLELAIRDDKEDLIATLEYNTDLFTPATIERISRHYQSLLTDALSDPNRPISMLPMVGEDEREQLLNEWNKTEFDYGERLFTHEMFQQQARQHPQAVALEFEDRQMSYAELNEKANQAAHYLRRQGVGPESVVGVYLERSMEMVIALLGVMKAGGAYLPIDVSNPAERVAYMLEDGGAKVVLTQEGLRQGLAGARAKVVSVDGLSDEIRRESGEDAEVELDGENLAYVIYTSGSTGRPKGAMNTHGAIRNRLLWMQQAYRLDSTDRVLQKTPFSFDVSVWEFFWPLMTGATLVIVSPGGHRDSQYLARLIAEKQITTVHFVPSMLAVFLQEPEAVDCKNLKRVICSGEALPKELSARCLRILPADLHNLYGPTEAAVDVTYWHCKPEDRRPAVPIGKPIANTQMYVVDENFNLLAIGMGGELCIGGMGLARGYLNSPRLTADKFVVDPFSSRAGARMYRTGDLARWATDGNLEFLGRIDSQVKIRGFRIEPGEIEATLTQHPAVEHAVAAIYPDESGGHRIVAYVVPDEAELRGKNGLQTEQVNQWQTVWNETYEPDSNIADPTFNIAGWKSSYSNQLMSDEEMREWLSQTVDRILALRPRRALEIGCGTGMLLFRIAPHCEEYWASDFSQEALNYVQKHAESLSDRLPIANLLCREASVFDGLDESSFDTIILNSVVQYFPAIEYLTQVLEGAIRIGSPGGTIFIGDVRSLPLLEAMHASVLLSQANDELDADRFVQLWRSAIKQEEELVVSQAYFAMLKRQFPKISHIEIKPKRGWHENEMNRFRYDVVIHLGMRPDFIMPLRTIEWSKEMLDLSGITQMLCEQLPDSLVITGVPNSRLHSDVAAVRMLRNIDGIQTVGELRQATNGSGRKGIHPEALWSLGDQLSYQVDLSWHAGRSDGSFDVAFLSRKRNGDLIGKAVSIEWPSPSFEGRPSFELANNPLRQKSTGSLGPELRRFVEQKLPEYMVPSSFVLLDALPLNANGKLDRKALKPPETQANATTKYVAPRNPLEETLCGIWEYILRLDRVGVEHNFFELGGHSLLATQVISRIRTLLSVKLPLQAIFKHPTVSKLALQIELTRRQQKQSIEPPLVRLDHKEPPPLSFAQQRLWFIDQLEPGSVYNMPGAVRLRGELDVAALRRSIREIIRRHEVLRTSFPQREGQPFQQINPVSDVDLPVIDLSDEPLDQAEASALTLAERETKRGFDLSIGPLMRTMLLKIADADHVLVVTMHHVVSDGWSVGILIREFMPLYTAYSAGRESGLEEVSLQYADFAVWQREYLKEEVLDEQMKYWKGQLEGVSVLELPTDRPRPAVASHRGESVKFSWGEELTGQMKALARQEGATLFMVVLAGFQVLLSRYSGQRDVAIGTDVANRNRSEIEGLIGFFVNQLVLRSSVEAEKSFEQLVKEVREVTLGAYEHQDLPFEKLVDEMSPERDMSRAPLFQVKLTLQNVEQAKLELDGLLVEEFSIQLDEVKVDMHLVMQETDGRLEGLLCYATDLYDRATAERMLEHLEMLMRLAARRPESLLCELDILSEAERQHVLYEWNQTSEQFGRPLCMHELFEQQTRQDPWAVALMHEGQQMSYRDLNARANKLARYLRRLGVGPETLVAVYLERSMDMVITLLGVLKAGGAYVPMDVNYPAVRLAYILEDAKADMLVTQSQLRNRLPESKAKVVILDSEWGNVADESSSDLQLEIEGDNLAYVIYTSGSTGMPKGVAIAHRNAFAMIMWARRLYAPEQLAGVLASTSICFDLSVFELFVPLSIGGKVILVEDALQLQSISERVNVTLINTVPSVMSELLNIDGLPQSAHTMNLAGEPLTRALAQRLYQADSVQRVYNLYGPSEDTTYSTFSFVEKEAEDKPTIGHPVSNSQAYVLDGNGLLRPMGLAGELYLAGQGISRGYLNKSGLTAERFVPDPFSSEPGARMYRTGDIVRRLANGELDYIGRVDCQVKIRGYRIELSEIEEVLGRCDGIEHCAVAVHDISEIDRRIVAYVVATQGRPSPSVRQLQQYLRSKLPKYMVPNLFVELEALPLSSNGKLDRRALPVPTQALTAHDDYQQPRTPTEEILCVIWQQSLKLDCVGIENNFFELGGHSLLATQVISRVREVFEVELPVRVLFEFPTVAALAQEIESAKGRGPLVALRINRASREGNPPLSFAQQRLWFISQLEPEAHNNVPGGVRLTGNLDVAALRYGNNEIIRRHEVLRTCFIQQDGQPVQVTLGPQSLPLPIIDLSQMDRSIREAEAKRLARQEAQQPFDLSAGPLLRATLIHMMADEHILLVTMHHIVFDGWSLGIFLRELSTLYEFYHLGGTYPLTDLPIQYADFSIWQRNYLQGEVLEHHLDYWRKQLESVSPLELPADFSRPAASSHRGDVVPFSLASEFTKELKALSQQQGATLFMTILTAFQILLARYANHRDVAIGTDIANRNRLETESLIGFFVNQVVLRSDLSGNPSFAETLGRVRRTVLDAYEHQDLPFEKLVEELQPERDLSRSPLFQVKLVLQNAARERLELPDLRLDIFPGSQSRQAKYDLTLFMAETPEGIDGALEYSTDLFTEATANQMLLHMRTLMESAVANPDAGIYDLPLLTDDERHQMLVDWNDTAVDYGARLLAHRLFEAQAQSTPDSLSVIFEGDHLTYRQLNEKANQLAHFLISAGVRPETRVAFCLNRSFEMIIALLGILKAGGAYVPLDPDQPEDRFASILDDCQAPILLTQRHLQNQLPSLWIQTICLDSDWAQIAGMPAADPVSACEPDNLAYIIYTSGSTGLPKGVAITHRGLANYLNWAASTYPLLEGDGSVVHSSIGFDLTITSIFPALLSGRSIRLLTDPSDFKSLSMLVDAHQTYSLIKLTPSHLQVINGICANNPPVGATRSLVIGGEALTYEHLSAWRANAPNTRLINEYGPTETVVGCCVYEVDHSSPNQGPVPIGKPIANTELYVLDSRLSSTQLTVAGELYIGGEGLARGYLGQPAMTAEKFVPNPFSLDPGSRLYRTGDLVRWMSDGNLQYLGRLDHQIKIRGYRIEPGEIEAILKQHWVVQDAAVKLWEYGSEDGRLVAYIVPRPNCIPEKSELLAHLRNRLPAYMVPGAIVVLEEFPLTINGKLDQNALPEPDSQAGATHSGRVEVLSPVEEILSNIWLQVLKADSVDIHTSFFELGGHSLLAMQMISRVMNSFKVELPLQAVFTSPTIAKLAVEIEQAKQQWRQVETPLLPCGPRPAELPLSYAQQRLWFLAQINPGNSFYNMPGAVRLKGTLNLTAVQNSLNEIVRRHEILRTSFPSIDGKPQQQIAEPASLPIHLIDFSVIHAADREDALRREMSKQSEYTFDLSAGPLLRVCLLRVSEDEHVLFAVMHHIISDGWSVEVLLREFDALYRAFDAEQPSPLPELSVQYADYAVWQRQWMQGEVLELQMNYWRQQLAGALTLELHTDWPREERTDRPSGSFSFQLPAHLYRELKQKCLEEGVTLFMLLLAAFQTLLHRHSGQTDIVTGSPAANRNRFETEDLIGYFINPLALRTSFCDNPACTELLPRVRETVLGAYAHQNVPFDLIVDDLAPARDLTRLPLFQTWFVLHNLLRRGNQPLSSLSATVMPVQTSGARLDLALEMIEDDQLRGVFVYAADLFRPETIARVAEHFEIILQSVAGNPDVSILDISLEQQQQDGANLETRRTDSRADFRF